MPAPATPPIVTDLVARAQAGDQAAFADLYRAHAGRVYAVCRRMVGDATAAEELTQDAFVRAWERLGTFRGESAFASWLHRLTVNVVLETMRQRRRREARVDPVDPAVFERVAAAAAAPGMRLDLEQAIAALPDGAREVFLLFDVEGYGHGEIARLMGIAEGTSKAQLFRARRLLRKALQR